MRIAETYSHLNGHEHLLVHQPKLLNDVLEVIGKVDASQCRTKVSKEKTMPGKILYDPKAMNEKFKQEFNAKGFSESRTSYYVTKDYHLVRKTLHLSKEHQKAEIESAGERAIYSYNQTDFVKNRVEIEVQFGKYFSVAYDLFVKHMAFFVGDVIDVGIEILPMKELQEQMSSGVPYYEGELYNLLRQGRSTPAVPLFIIGIAP